MREQDRVDDRERKRKRENEGGNEKRRKRDAIYCSRRNSIGVRIYIYKTYQDDCKVK